MNEPIDTKQPRLGGHSLARTWLMALGVTLFVTAVSSVVSREPGAIELQPPDRDWSRETIGPIAYPPQVDETTPVWEHWLPTPQFANFGPNPPADEATRGLVFHAISVTGYSSRVQETDASPFITAINTVTAPGVLAMSRDLLRTFTPGAPFDFGDRVLISGVGVYQVEDTMHPRWTRRADVWFPSTEEAWAWGRRETYVTTVDERTPIDPYEIPLALLAQEPIDLRHHSGLSTPWRILE